MARGTMRVTVNHPGRPGFPEQCFDAFARHVVARRGGSHAACFAFGTHALGEPLAPSERPREKQHLRKAVASEPTKPLIPMIRRAQRIAVRERDARAKRGDRDRIGQPDRTRSFHEALAQQEVAIAVHDVERDAAFRQRMH